MKRKISVFIASPGDLSVERQLFRDVIGQLNIGFGDGANIEFEALGWEDTLASTGRRNQDVINAEVDRCDVFILALYRRWGQEVPDSQIYSSYTEEEFHRAFDRWKKCGTPEIFVFFKRVDAASEADPGTQLQKVMSFRRHLEDTRKVLYRYFNNEASFTEEIDRHLRTYAKGELPKLDLKRDALVLPMAALEEVKKARAVAAKKADEAEKAHDEAEKSRLKIEAMQLQIAEDAAQFALEGKIEYARQKFSEIVIESENIRILFLGFEFFNRIGDLDAALLVLEKWLNLSGPDKQSGETASAYGNLGIIHETRGDHKRAEEMYQRALAIQVSLGLKSGVASQSGNLGTLYLKQGELKLAEDLFNRVLRIEAELNIKDGTTYGNLGILYQKQGDSKHAEQMHLKSLAIAEEISDKMGMANQYGNLGIIYKERGKFKRAEEMYKKSLAIEELLGHKEGMAADYANLGVLYQQQDDVERAEEMCKKSLAISEDVGVAFGIAYASGNLGAVYLQKKEPKSAEEMIRRALTIFEELGIKEGVAQQLFNLGLAHKIQGDIGNARVMYEKSLLILEEIGSTKAKQVAQALSNL